MKGRVTYQTLDGMRGVAALGVVLLHAIAFGAPLAPSAVLAPDLFFCISGFVIAYAYDERLRNDMRLPEFLKIRLIRLYPLYLIGLAVGASVAWQTVDHTEVVKAVSFSLFFLPHSISSAQPSHNLFALNPPAWSLFYEIVVNLIYALAFQYLTIRRIGIAVAGLGFSMLMIGMLRGTMMGGWNANPGQICIGLIRVGFSFGVGLLIYRLRDRQPRIAAPPVLLLAAVGVIMALNPAGPLRLILEIAAVFVFFPILVIAGTQVQPMPRLTPLFTVLGVTSYGIYAIHEPLLKATALVWPSGNRLGEVAFFAVLIAMVCCLDRWVDLPTRRALQRHFVRRPVAAQQR